MDKNQGSDLIQKLRLNQPGFFTSPIHIWLSEDERESTIQKYSGRMGNAYKINKQFQNRRRYYLCAKVLNETLQKAKEQER
jgi:hypothetical protein